MSSTYPRKLVEPYQPSHTLCLADQLRFKVPKIKLKSFGDRSISKAAPILLWNALACTIRAMQHVLSSKANGSSTTWRPASSRRECSQHRTEHTSASRPPMPPSLEDLSEADRMKQLPLLDASSSDAGSSEDEEPIPPTPFASLSSQLNCAQQISRLFIMWPGAMSWSIQLMDSRLSMIHYLSPVCKMVICR